MNFQALASPFLTLPGITQGAQEMARTDPHGWILTLVSVSVVFSALAILWFMFSLLFERPAKRKAAPRKAAVKATPDGEVAAAIAIALHLEGDDAVAAAISLGLHLYLSESVHDEESYVITIKR